MQNLLSNLPDEELTEAIKASDADAFKVLYLRYQKALYGFLWRRTRDPQTSQDLLQETFIRVWKYRLNLDPNRSIKAYLYRIAANLATDHSHKKSSRMAVFTDNPPGETASFQQDDIELREEILAAIELLPEPLKQVLTLNRFDGLKYREIAEALNISVKTVESRMSKALKNLREKLSPFFVATLFFDFFP